MQLWQKREREREWRQNAWEKKKLGHAMSSLIKPDFRLLAHRLRCIFLAWESAIYMKKGKMQCRRKLTDSSLRKWSIFFCHKRFACVSGDTWKTALTKKKNFHGNSFFRWQKKKKKQKCIFAWKSCNDTMAILCPLHPWYFYAHIFSRFFSVGL